MNEPEENNPALEKELVLSVESVSAVFAHDIATPLTTALMNADLLVEYCQLLDKGLESENAQNIPQHIRAALARAPELVKKNIEAVQQSLIDYKVYLNALQSETENTIAPSPPISAKNEHMTILVVDDEDIHHDIAGAVLGRKHTLSFEKSGEGAISRCREEHFDTILMDMKMPGLSGEQTVEKLREFIPDSTLIMGLTNLPMAKRNDNAGRGGFNAFMEKPLRLDIFELLVDTVTKQNH